MAKIVAIGNALVDSEFVVTDAQLNTICRGVSVHPLRVC